MTSASDPKPRASAIDERPELLDAMVRDAKGQPGIYQPGPYWKSKTRAAVRQIRRHGLSEFRGYESGVGTSFTDCVTVDVRTSLDTPRGRPLKFLLDRVFPLSTVMRAQVTLTRGYAEDWIALTAARTLESAETRDLLARYDVPDSLLGGCVATANVGGRDVSIQYLRALQVIDRARRHVALDEARSLFEIGGGFGANVHLQLQLFPKLRKVVYLDVPPNLYVGTSYLRTLYGDAVRDYLETRRADRIAFRDDDSLEIVAICPWQIEALDLEVDLFWNAHSFLEMPWDVVTNYADKVMGLRGAAETSIVLAAYGGGASNVIDPDRLPTAFPGREFSASSFWMLGWPNPARSTPEHGSLEVSLFVSPGAGVGVLAERPATPAS